MKGINAINAINAINNGKVYIIKSVPNDNIPLLEIGSIYNNLVINNCKFRSSSSDFINKMILNSILKMVDGKIATSKESFMVGNIVTSPLTRINYFQASLTIYAQKSPSGKRYICYIWPNSLNGKTYQRDVKELLAIFREEILEKMISTYPDFEQSFGI